MVIVEVSSMDSSCFMTACAPPARSKTSITCSPTGRTEVKTGTSCENFSNMPYTSAPQLASVATACKCLIELTEPPTDKIVLTAFSNALSVRMSLGLRSSHTISTMRLPALRAASNMASLLAATGVVPGRAMPNASQQICIELAVPMPEQTPGPRMAFRLMPMILSIDMRPICACMAPTKTSSISTCSPSNSPLG